jgi:hypothetical protein
VSELCGTAQLAAGSAAARESLQCKHNTRTHAHTCRRRARSGAGSSSSPPGAPAGSAPTRAWRWETHTHSAGPVMRTVFQGASGWVRVWLDRMNNFFVVANFATGGVVVGGVSALDNLGTCSPREPPPQGLGSAAHTAAEWLQPSTTAEAHRKRCSRHTNLARGVWGSQKKHQT